MEPTPRTTPDEWGAKNRVYGATTGVPGPRNPRLTAYMIPAARVVHLATHRRVVAVTAAQSGKTDNIFDVMGARLDQRPAPILYVGPSRDFVTDQFEPRFETLLTEAPSLRSKLPPRRKGKKTLKRVAGVMVRMGWAGSSTSLKSDPFGLGIVDEYDEMLSNVKGQGDPLGLVEARGETYADFVTLVVSTPSQGAAEVEKDEVNGLEFWSVVDPELIQSPIWRLFQQGTRHHFAWPCPHCDEFFVPMFKHLWWPKGSTPAQARRTARIVCPSCGTHIDEGEGRATKLAMIDAGVQVAPGQTIEDARAMVNEPDNATWSCWTSGLCSPFVSWGERAEKYLQALASGEPDKIQTVMNAAFGELYSHLDTSDQPEWAEVMQRKLPYRAGEVPTEAYRLVMGVDVQKFSLLYTVRAYGARGTSWLVENGQLYGPTEAEEVWSALADRMLTPFGDLMVEKVGIDSGFRPGKKDAGSEHKVYEFCRRYPWLCVPTKGRNVQAQPFRLSKIEVKPDGKRPAYSVQLAWLSSDFFKSMVFAKIRTPMGAPGAWYVHEQVTEDYCRQITSEVRTIKDGLPVWVQRARDNHYLDCEAICEAMAYTLNVQRIPEGPARVPANDDDAEPAPTVPAGPRVPEEAITTAAPPPDRRARMAARAMRAR